MPRTERLLILVVCSVGLISAVQGWCWWPDFGQRFSTYSGNPLLTLEGNDPWDSNGDTHLQIPGSVHPDVLYFPSGMDGFKFWMVFTPPPERDSVPWDPTVQPNWYWERPTLVRSNDGLNWQKTADYANPLLVPGNGTDWDASWLADPDLVYAPGKGPNGESWFLYYNGVNADPSISQSSIGVALSSDG